MEAEITREYKLTYGELEQAFSQRSEMLSISSSQQLTNIALSIKSDDEK